MLPGYTQSGLTRTWCVLALVFTASLLVALFPAPVRATTPQIQQAQSEAEALMELVDQLYDEMSAATEEYNYANQQLEDTKAAVKKTTRELTQAEKDIAAAQQLLDQRLVAIYKTGRTRLLAVLMDSDSFLQLVTGLDQLSRLSQRDSMLIEQVEGYKSQEAEQKATLETQMAQQKTYAAETAAAREKVLAQLDKQKEALRGKEALVAKLKKEEAARQAKLAAEARARKAFLASRPGKVISYAMDYLGVPYVWGGSSPRGFDCSGLVQYVYAKIGIKLPHSSRMQYSCGKPVASDQLKPGDLVFYYHPIQHVAIYMGDGKIIHATGNQVQIGSVWRRGYYGACRVLL